ncbi:MAG: methionyl-tRNA formyltransferase [Candidatus Aminicenantales bacterium]
MRIVFFGSPTSALPSLQKILEAGHRVELIITQPDKPSGRGKKLTPCPVKKFALERNIACYEPERIRQDSTALEKIQRINPDINVVVAYGQIIPSSIIDLPPYKSVNIHFSLLPKYRGASPVQWAILNGEKKTGITIIQLNEKMDEGDILLQREVAIFHGEYAHALESRLAQIGAELLITALSAIHQIRPVPQEHALATYAPKLHKESGCLDWTKEAAFIDRQVRALTPWPSAHTFLRGKRIIILEGREKESARHLCSPGKIMAVSKEGIDVCCGDGCLYLITRLQPENRKAMSAYAYALGIKKNDLSAFD